MTQVLELGTTRSYGVEHGAATNLNKLPALAYHRVILVSSHPLFLLGLRTELSHCSDFKVVGEVGSATEALELVANSPVGLIVIDQARPGQAHSLIRSLQHKLNGRIPVVVLGSSENEIQVAQLRQLGITNFASKALDGNALCQVLRQAVKDRRPLPGIRSAVSDGWSGRSALGLQPVLPARPKTRVRSPLSPREIQILQVIAQGCSNKEVAQILCISNHTLKNHLNNIFKKLDVEDRTQALMLSVRNGWVEL